MILNLQGYMDRSPAGTKEAYIQHLDLYIKLHWYRVRQRRCPLAPDKWFWPVDKWVVNLTCPLDK